MIGTKGHSLNAKSQSALVNVQKMNLLNLSSSFYEFFLFVFMAGMLLALMLVPAAVCVIT